MEVKVLEDNNTDDHHLLSYKWILWEHQNTNQNYEQNTREVGKFKTIEDFWKHYNNYPVPSKIFYNGYKPKLANPTREISSLSLFKEGVFPKWEDPKNNSGADLAIRSFASLDQLDYIWETMSMLCIGDQYTVPDDITGIRIVDSSIPNKKVLYRIEIWFSDKNNKELVEKDLKSKLSIDNIELFYKEHSTAVESTPYRNKRYNNNNNRKKNYGFRRDGFNKN